MEITINAPKLGAHPGTTGFIMEYLSRTQLSVRTTKRGNIALFMKTATEENWDMVCMYCPNPDDAIYYHYENYGDGYYAKYECEDGHNERKSLFGPLTPAGKALATKFIGKCVNALRSAIDSDGEGIEFKIEIV